ncbi:hypothetical protein V6N12_072069 [Hibiscus sabdariffa]|uniref:Uncharacterized protein n=1 Tax=Hibiscus sabdariffa TaxID=183260 RepID=A0ABR2FLL2_9ROSI
MKGERPEEGKLLRRRKLGNACWRFKYISDSVSRHQIMLLSRLSRVGFWIAKELTRGRYTCISRTRFRQKALWTIPVFSGACEGSLACSTCHVIVMVFRSSMFRAFEQF